MGPRCHITILGAGVDGLKGWLERLPLPWRRWRVTHLVESADDVPECLPYRGAALVMFGVGKPGWLVFDCPCAYSHRVLLNLDPERQPRWQTLSLDPLTIHPSVDDLSNSSRCHYLIHGGRVIWATDLLENEA